MSLRLFKNWKIVETSSSATGYNPPRTLEPVFFQFCKGSCSEMKKKKKTRCFLQLVSPISSLIYRRRELCFRNSNVFHLGRMQDAGLTALHCRGNTRYQFFLHFNEIFSSPCSHSKHLPLVLTAPHPFTTFVVKTWIEMCFQLLSCNQSPAFFKY